MTPPSRPGLDDLAGLPIDGDDLDLLSHVARIYDAMDPVPSGLVERIRFGITLDALEVEIAGLQRSGELSGVRADGAADTQTITFTSAHLTTMITVTVLSADQVRIDGWVAPGGGVSVELRRPDGSDTTTADADGRFVFAAVGRGLARFVLRAPGQLGQPPVITPSVEF